MSQSSTLSSISWSDRRGGVEKIADCMKEMLARGESSDVQFAIGRSYGGAQVFPAHKLIMSARSNVFHQMFYGALPEKCTAPIDIPDILPEAFANMLSYIYTDAVKSLNEDNVFETLNCADKYDLPSLVDTCSCFILSQLKTANCLQVLEKAARQTCAAPHIKEECLRLIDVSAGTILQSEQFCSIGQEALRSILERDTFDVDETAIYSSLERWAAYNCSQRNIDASSVNRREVLGAVLYLVRFPLLTDAQLLDGPAKTGLLLQSEAWNIFNYKHAAIKPQLPFPVEPRQSARSGVINYTIPGLRMLDVACILSDPVTVKKLSWRISVSVTPMPPHGVRCLSYFLQCEGNPESLVWTSQIKGELRVLPWKAEIAPVKIPISHLFSPKEPRGGFNFYMELMKLLNPVKGYVNPMDFSLKLQAEFTAELPPGS